LGVIDALNEGFRIVLRKPVLLSIPILLDLGLLISPKPSLSQFMLGVGGIDADGAQALGTLVAAILLLLVALHVPSLGAGATSDFGDLGGAVELAGGGAVFGWALVLLLIGVIISTAYLGLLRRTIYPEAEEPQLAALIMDRAPHLLGLAALAVASLLGLILLFVLAMAFMSFVAIFVGMAVAVGLIAIPFLLFFANLSVIVDGSSPRGAIRRSIELISSDALPVAGIIILTVVVQLMTGIVLAAIIGSAVGFAVAVAANAFIGTVLAAGSMVFYLSRTYDVEFSHEVSNDGADW
jgi:hypothetical protein